MISAPASITFANASAALAKLAESLSAARAGDSLDVDCAALADFDSTAIAVLLDLQRRALAAKVVLRCVNLPANMRKLAALYGVERLIGTQGEPA